ncbi:MAG: DUF3784 domain-containing protein [Clostridia bacterium]|nr:DUF3784 domain-containing protein [Clostridia bacterium]
MLIADVLVFLMFLILGFMFFNGKGAFLISGYNTLSKEKKAEYDLPALLDFMGKMMFVLSFCSTFWLFADILDRPILFNIGIGLFIAATAFIVIYSNTGNRFKKNKKR